ncbi:MAG: 50S ribosome-binding GTPase [Planctomycetota bacterium]|nr:50S ribosome-binding GTPase [Planctomycetota bacterium]
MSRPVARELSPRGAGGVSVLEIAGDGASAALQNFLGRRLAVGELRLVRVELEGELVDEALAWCESDARVELHLHGSVPLVRRVLQALDAAGVAAHDTELPKCASAEELLANAACEDAARILLDQVEGAFERELASWDTLSLAEIETRARALARRSAVARLALEPARVVLAGPVNAGKSTLFNLLHGRERVVTSAQAGTTRDAVLERVRLGAWPVELVDTAGEREGDDGLERRGIELARELRTTAELVLWLSPADAPVPPPPGLPRVVTLHSRSDLGSHDAQESISVVRDPQAALAAVERAFRRAFDLPLRAWEPGAAVAFDAAGRTALDELLERLARRDEPGSRAVLAQLRSLAR